MARIFAFFIIAILIAGCESETGKSGAKKFDNIMFGKQKKSKQESQSEPSISDQLTREIHSQTDKNGEKEGKFKFGSK